MKKKGSFFFVLDAFIAGIIIATSLFVLFSSFSKENRPSQELFLAEDYLSILSNTKVNEMDNEYVRELIKNKEIINPEVSIMDQMIIFFFEDKKEDITFFAKEVGKVIPKNRGFNISIDNTSVYSYRPYVKESSLLLKASRMAYVINQTDILGPVIVEVNVWG